MGFDRTVRWVCALLASLLCLGVADAADKIPITTSSEEARQLYLQGRDLAEKLRGRDGRDFYKQALAKDQSFAMAHLGLALTAPSAKEFFSELNQVEKLESKVSEGEQLLIRGFIAGVKDHPETQRECYSKLVEVYPQDERARSWLGGFFFGRQEHAEAIQQYEKAIEINPSYSPAYNQLGYAYRNTGNFSSAKDAFKKYIELIPTEPNPYDSYAELLMKMGQFDESIVNYQKALKIDPSFVASYVGIGNNYIFKEQPEEARKTFKRLFDRARDNGERRTALFWMATSFVHEGNHGKALEELEKRYAIAERAHDSADMSGDLNTMGDVLLESGDPDGAQAKYRKSLEVAEKADLLPEVKEAARRNHLYYQARVALAKKAFKEARSLMEQCGEQAKAKMIPSEVRRYHQLAGMLALEEKSYDQAVSQLKRANMQNPEVLYRIALASWAKGEKGAAREAFVKAATFNQGTINYAFVRAKAKEKAEEK